MNAREYNAKPGKSIEEHYEELLEVLNLLYSYGYIESKRLYDLIRYACIHHDDGKVNYQFQKRVNSLTKKLRFNPDIEVPHNVLSAYFVDPSDFETDVDYYRVLHAILNHHDYGDALSIIKEKDKLINSLLEGFSVYTIKNRVKLNLARIVDDKEAIKIKGFLHKCDYSASGGYTAEYPNNFLEDSLNNVRDKWKRQDPSSDWNELQRFCIDKREENIIVVAQTGMGKTEAGLQWIGNHKGYFVLPLRTAINAIYDRVRNDILLNEDINRRLCILHSDSLEYYTKKVDNEEMDIFEYENRGKQFALPLSIATMDQLFDFIFKYQGYELKLTTFAYSKIVIDEIQMYDPELLAYLIHGLKCIHDMGGKIAIMTATLSPFVKELLKRDISFEEENCGTFVDNSIRHNVMVKSCKINADDILEKYHANKRGNKGNKILVVCNTIDTAQKLYEELRNDPDPESNIHVNILHSRYTRRDRGELEQEILRFGKTYSEDGSIDIQSGIWVSTSLVEASLDIDFDYLFTELQDLNSLFQRMGRCNRKGKKSVLEHNCYVYTEIQQKLIVGSNAFIDETVFRLSKQAIETIEGELSERKKLDLLDRFLTMENLDQSGYYRKYKYAKELVEGISAYEFEKNENKLRNILSEDIIPSPVYEEYIEEIHAWENSLLMEHADNVEKVKLRANIMQYAVNIPYWQWIDYKKSSANGYAESYPEIRLSRKEGIQVVECFYDETGYRKMDYKNEIRNVNIL